MPTLQGKWQLTKVRAFDETGQDAPSPFGPQPIGIMLFEVDRMIGVIADGLAGSSLPSGRAFFSYTGSYQFDGERLVTRVDGASSPAGFADQIRKVSFDGPDRIVLVPLTPVLNHSSGLQLTWERIS